MSSTRSTRMKKKILDSKKIKVKETAVESDDLKNEDCDCPKVTLSYDVLRIIFADLLARDLCNAAMVCRLWREVAEYELKHRKLIIHLTDYKTSFDVCNSKQHFSNGLINKPMLSLFFNGSQWDSPECLGKHFPRSCVNVTVVNHGVIKDNKELESCKDDVAYALLPDDPNVNMEFIGSTKTKLTRINRKKNKYNKITQQRGQCYIESMMTDALKSMKDIKCMIIFTSEKCRRYSEKLLKLNVFKDNNVKAIWGGVVKGLYICHTNEAGIPETQDLLWLTILISGPDVKCWSTFVDDSDDSSVTEALLALKERIKVRKHTIGFMFSCIARGADWYNGEKNVESTIFKTMFPNIPLIGSYGNGEYGIHSQNKCPFNDGLDHEYSTTFMILTYG